MLIRITARRIHFIGVRFTDKEKEKIDKFIKKRETSYNEFVREAVLSYMNNLETVKNKVNFNRIQLNIENFEKLLPNLIKNIHSLYKEFGDFRLNKETYFIT